MEIERKYAVKQMPENFMNYPCKKIEQGYLCNNPTVRIRKSNEDYILTYKSKVKNKKEGSAIFNNEVELELTEEAYKRLLLKIDHNPVTKSRYLIPLTGGLTAELDVFGGKLQGLIIVEVEFPDEQASNEFVPPDWFGKDLSSDRRYSNYYLSQLSSSAELK